MTKHISSKASRLQEQWHAISVAISKGVIVQVNIQGVMRKLISAKYESGQLTFLYHDEMDNLCMFKANRASDVELLVRIESEVGNA